MKAFKKIMAVQLALGLIVGTPGGVYADPPTSAKAPATRWSGTGLAPALPPAAPSSQSSAQLAPSVGPPPSPLAPVSGGVRNLPPSSTTSGAAVNYPVGSAPKTPNTTTLIMAGGGSGSAPPSSTTSGAAVNYPVGSAPKTTTATTVTGSGGGYLTGTPPPSTPVTVSVQKGGVVQTKNGVNINVTVGGKASKIEVKVFALKDPKSLNGTRQINWGPVVASVTKSNPQQGVVTIPVTGLKPNTMYAYAVYVNGALQFSFSSDFRTL